MTKKKDPTDPTTPKAPKPKKPPPPRPRFRGDPTTTTLADASLWMQEALATNKSGVICPCCDRYGKIYSRLLSSSMAYALILIYKAFRTRTDWLHVPEYLTEMAVTGATTRGGDYAKLVFWGLLEPKTDEVRADGSPRTGFFKITDRGRQFVDGKLRVVNHAVTYGGRLIRFEGPEIDIYAALKNRFNYAELMAS